MYGIWAVVRTAVATNDTRTVYRLPGGDVPVGKSIEGPFIQTFIGQEVGPSVFFSGEGFCYQRSSVDRGSQAFEVKLAKQRDVPLGEKLSVTATFGFAPMPKILRPAVTSRAPLSLSAKAPAKVALYGKCEIDVTLAGTWDNPYDPDEIALDATVTTASGKTYTQPGFFMVPQRHALAGVEDFMLPAGEGQWKVRLAATEQGPMRVTLTARDRTGQAAFVLPQAVTVMADKKAKGFVRVSRADAHYLSHDSGEGYVPVGHNVPIYQSSNGMSQKDILEKMAANGENWNR